METQTNKAPKAASNAPFFDPNADFVAKTPIPVTTGPATAIPVLAIYRPNVKGKAAIEIYFALVGRNGCLFDPETGQPTQCAVIRGTWWLTGTRNDKGARDAFKAVCHAMSYTAVLQSLEQAIVDKWLADMVSTWRPVTLILENEDSEGRYKRVRHVNPVKPLSDAYTKALKDSGVVAMATTRAQEIAKKVAASTGGGGGQQIEVADDIPF